MRFILRKSSTIFGISTMMTMLCLCMFMIIGEARSSVCFLPGTDACGEGETRTDEVNFWPGSGGDADIKTSGQCDSTYTSTTPYDRCGNRCTRCNDVNSIYYDKYKCENLCDCRGYTSVNSVNECGEKCAMCTITGDPNYGKYKCPACDSEPESDEEMCDLATFNMPASNLTQTQITKHCYDSCYVTSENEKYWRCDSCFGYDYILPECLQMGYDKTKGEACSGKNGSMYEGCCNSCQGYDDTSDKSDSVQWKCTEKKECCDTGASRWKCENICSGYYTSKSGDGKCWDYTYRCQENNGTQHYTRSENIRSGYEIKDGSCVQQSTDEICIVFNYRCGNGSCSDDIVNKIDLNLDFSGGEELISSKVDHKKYCFKKSSISSYEEDNYVSIDDIEYNEAVNKGNGTKTIYYAVGGEENEYRGSYWSQVDDLVASDYSIKFTNILLPDPEVYDEFNGLDIFKESGKLKAWYRPRENTAEMNECLKYHDEEECYAFDVDGDIVIDISVAEIGKRCITADVTCHGARYSGSSGVLYNDCVDATFKVVASTDKNEVSVGGVYQIKDYTLSYSQSGEVFTFETCDIPGYDAGILEIKPKEAAVKNVGNNETREEGGYAAISPSSDSDRPMMETTNYRQGRKQELFVGFGEDARLSEDFYPIIIFDGIFILPMGDTSTGGLGTFSDNQYSQYLTSFCEGTYSLGGIKANRKLPFDLVVEGYVQYNGGAYVYGAYHTCDELRNAWLNNGLVNTYTDAPNPAIPEECKFDYSDELIFKKDSQKAFLVKIYDDVDHADNFDIHKVCNYSCYGYCNESDAEGQYNSLWAGHYGCDGYGHGSCECSTAPESSCIAVHDSFAHITKVYAKDHYDGVNGAGEDGRIPGTDFYVLKSGNHVVIDF